MVDPGPLDCRGGKGTGVRTAISVCDGVPRALEHQARNKPPNSGRWRLLVGHAVGPGALLRAVGPTDEPEGHADECAKYTRAYQRHWWPLDVPDLGIGGEDDLARLGCTGHDLQKRA